MFDYLVAVGPIAIGMIVYFIHLETRLTKMCTDIDWIKKYIHACQRN